MRFEELRFLCEEAAKDLLTKHERPVPPTVVLPTGDTTRLMTLPSFPTDDAERHAYLKTFARTQITEPGIPAWGFVVEADVDDHPAIVITFGARRHTPHVAAAPFDDEGLLGEWTDDEELDPRALPFLHPLQTAVDAIPAEQQGGPDALGAETEQVLPLFQDPGEE